MATALTTVRDTIAAVVKNDALWNTFSFPPSVPIANSVVVTPDDPYVTITNNMQLGISPMAHFKLVILVPMKDNEGNLVNIETNMVAVFNLLAASTLNLVIGDFHAPTVLSAGGVDLLMTEISLSLLTSWS